MYSNCKNGKKREEKHVMQTDISYYIFKKQYLHFKSN